MNYLNHRERSSRSFSIPKADFNQPYRRIGSSKVVENSRVLEKSSIEVFDYKERNGSFKVSDFSIENLSATGALESLSLPQVQFNSMRAADLLDSAAASASDYTVTEPSKSE